MQYQIIGETMPAVEITFDAPGEEMFTQSGGMAWMSGDIEMTTNTRGGLMKGLGRMFAGESLFMATYRAGHAGEQITFASTVAGRILDLNVAEHQGLICQKGAFLCAQDGVSLSVTFSKNSRPASSAAKASSSKSLRETAWSSSRWTAIWSKRIWRPARS